MIRFSIFLLFIIPLSAFSPALQVPDIIVKIEAQKMTTDNLGNIYLTHGESVSKYDSVGVLQKSFSNKNYGAITSVDATNALRIIVFYKDFNRIVTLDNTMSENGDPIKLESIGFSLASLAAASHDNGLWIYDQSNFELIRLNRNLQIENRSGNLAQLLGIELQPNFLIEKDNRVFLNNPSSGILVFDIFGTYSKLIPINKLNCIQVVDGKILYFQFGSLQMWDLNTSEQTTFDEPLSKTALDMRYEQNALFVLEEKELHIYNK